ncbi:MAG: urate hydroxylase PuuD [Saprospiraceae bacterium]|nr:urate hydroxylase PuuD [Saprospiraceae bacterium]
MKLVKPLITIFKIFATFCFIILVADGYAHSSMYQGDTSTIEIADTIVQNSIVNTSDIEEKVSYFDKLLADEFLPFFLLLIFIFIVLYYMAHVFVESYNAVNKKKISTGANIENNENQGYFQATLNALYYIIPISIFSYLIYIAVKGTMMQGYTMEWLNLIIRWAHVVAGIMWIGASFYFVFLENNLNRTKNIRDELAGNLWAVHGGGFYFLEKYRVAPNQIPNDLHWFKYEAYFTFLTGFSLLVVVYYMNADSFLIDPSVADISIGMAIGISLLCLVGGWWIYDMMCKSSIVNKSWLFIFLGILLLSSLAYFLTHVFNSRAAFIHFGAVIGTIMVGNVFFNIIPAQKEMVKAATLGLPLDPSLGQKAGQRSLHNNYFTLPVIYVMISNHFPSTFGHEYNWAVLIVISLASAGIKHYWNLVERGQKNTKILIISVVSLFSLALVISPAFEAKMDLAVPVSFLEVKEVIDNRCIQCHSASPTDDVWKAAPNGVMYDTPEQVKNMSDKIMARAVRTKTMPQANKTNMTDDERKILKRWILQGAKID